MGKNYIESSLKRFLKRKVKITLGVVVTFLITGMVSFAGDNKPVEEMNDFEKAEHYLAGINTKTNLSSEWSVDLKSNKKIEINENDNKITFSGFSSQATNEEVSINPKLLSNETWNNIETTFKNAKENGIVTEIKAENLGVIDNNAYEVNKFSANKGIIINTYGQKISAGSIGINYGIIKGKEYSQYINYATSRANAYNYGMIIGKQLIRNFSNYSSAENNGLILGNQKIEGGQENKILNYGVILSTNTSGQSIGTYNLNLSFQRNNEAVNYGIIKVEKNDVAGQFIDGYAKDAKEEKVIINSNLKNYGYIESSGCGQKIYQGLNNTTENYGVIKTNNNGYAITIRNGVNADKDIADRNKGFNYGTVIVDTTTNKQTPVKVFEGDVTNKGLVILDNYTGTDLTNITLGDNSAEDKGLIFKKGDDGYSLLNSNKVAQYTGGNKNITNTFTDSKTTTAYVTGTNNKITENLSDKVIGTIVKDDISEKGAVITADKDLTFENTVITGYFENKGTLLDMGKHNLSLLGDTKLVASKDNFNLKEKEIYALNIDGTLKMVGNAEIAGKITGTGKIQEVAVNGDNGKHDSAFEINEVLLQNATEQEEKYLETVDDNYTEVSYNGGLETEKVILDFDRTAKDKENTITFTDNLLIKGNKNGVAIDGTSTETGNNINLNFSSLDSEKVKGDILLGASNDDIVVERNGKYNSTIDMGAGNDSFTVNGFAQSTIKADNHKELGTFNYKLAGVETITLKGNGEKNQGWHIGEHASLSDVNGATLKVENTELHVDMNNNYGKGDVTTSLDKLAGEKGANNLTISTSKDDTGKDTGVVKFVVGDKFNVSDKQFEVAHDYSVKGANLGTAVIFKGTGKDGAVEEKDGKIALTVKEASEIENSKGQTLANYKGIYDTMLGALSSNEDLRAAVNYSDANNLVDMVVKTNNTASAFYTTGYAVTKDVTDTYMSIVDYFGRKAGAGEWIAYGKYVNSDTEFDGGKASKGYDGDITGTVGMIEYGVNDTTSYGAVFGKGDTKVDINGGGKLDGDNTYAGLYMKHKTQTGIDLTANVGYTKSDLDLNLATSASNYNMITDGSSDSTALTFALKGTKDYKLSESMRLQPVVSARYSLINQDAVESKDANFRIDEQDVTIFEGAFGGNVIKDFDVYNGTLSLKAGAEFVLTEVSKSDDGRYTLYGKDITLIDEEDIADNRIRTHIGAEYIHENGVGIDAKYEVIFTDKGDTDRITAGVSYKF